MHSLKKLQLDYSLEFVISPYNSVADKERVLVKREAELLRNEEEL
ncbi:hypothetical protein I3760_16G110000 [Carya illinoinensis]|nr:hypothetical protein I3760_16G110000 [Carya illinoinensis]